MNCPKCKRDRPLTDFVKAWKYCRACRREYNRQHFENNREYHAKRQQNKQELQRREVHIAFEDWITENSIELEHGIDWYTARPKVRILPLMVKHGVDVEAFCNGRDDMGRPRNYTWGWNPTTQRAERDVSTAQSA